MAKDKVGASGKFSFLIPTRIRQRHNQSLERSSAQNTKELGNIHGVFTGSTHGSSSKEVENNILFTDLTEKSFQTQLEVATGNLIHQEVGLNIPFLTEKLTD